MADYRAMYVHLFQETTTAIEILQKAQQWCEENYLNGEETIRTISESTTQTSE